MTARRIAVTSLAAFVMTGAALASAQSPAPKKALGKLTCEEFLGVDESFRPKMVYYAAAYSRGGAPEAAMLDVEGTEKLIPVIVEKCKASPKDSFYQKVKAEAKK